MYEYKATWHKSISDILPSQWNNVFPETEILKSYNFIKAIEYSKLTGVEYTYLVITNNKLCVSIIPCFVYRLDLSLLASKEIKKIISWVRRFFSGFLYQKNFFIGTPVSVCNHIIGLRQSIDEMQRKNIVNIINAETKKKYKEYKCTLLIVKEIPANERSFFDSVFSDGFYTANSLPNTYLPVLTELSKFPEFIRSRYKKNINRKIRAFNKSQLKWEQINNFSDIKDKLSELYYNVYNKSDNKFELIESEFFSQISENLPECSFVFVAKNEQGLIVAMILFLFDEDSLIPLYLGIDYDKTEDSEIYFNCIYKIIEIAEQRKFKWIKLGQTSYKAKAYSGALFEKLFIYAYTDSLLYKILLKYFSNIVFPISSIEYPACYTIEALQLINEKLEKKPYLIDNLILNDEKSDN